MSKKPAPSFDDTRQYKNDRNSSKEVKEYCSTCGEAHGKKCPEYYLVSKEEPKPECDHVKGTECDHIVGIAYQGALGFAQKASDPIKNYIQKFNYCPECGEKLNLKKDEEL